MHHTSTTSLVNICTNLNIAQMPSFGQRRTCVPSSSFDLKVIWAQFESDISAFGSEKRNRIEAFKFLERGLILSSVRSYGTHVRNSAGFSISFSLFSLSLCSLMIMMIESLRDRSLWVCRSFFFFCRELLLH